MEITGERHVLSQDFSSVAEYYNHLMHLATYHFAQKYVKGKKVLDYGCGSGYGSCFLAENADHVLGADISKEAVDYASDHFKEKNLVFKTIENIGDEKFDVITSFQVIEHVPNDKEYIRTLKNHLNPNGILLISTPDRANRLYPFQQPWNIFHLKEYSSGTLKKTIAQEFNQVKILKITSDKDFVMTEIQRTQKLKKICLPCTLPLFPNFVRVSLLKLQANLFHFKKKIFSKSTTTSEENSATKSDFISTYSVESIRFEDNPEFSSDLLAICSNN